MQTFSFIGGARQSKTVREQKSPNIATNSTSFFEARNPDTWAKVVPMNASAHGAGVCGDLGRNMCDPILYIRFVQGTIGHKRRLFFVLIS